MATGRWEYRNGFRVWVADPVVSAAPKPVAKSSAQAIADAKRKADLAAAKVRAAQVAANQAKIAAASKAGAQGISGERTLQSTWDLLRQRTAELLNSAKDPRMIAQSKTAGRVAAQAALMAERAKKAADAALLTKILHGINTPAPSVAKGRRPLGQTNVNIPYKPTPKDGRRLEALYAEAQKRQADSQGKYLDSAQIGLIDNAYKKYVDGATKAYETVLKPLEPFLKKDKDGAIIGWKDQASYLKGTKILGTKVYMDAEAEYKRLYGYVDDEGKEHQGSVVPTIRTRENIAEAQRQYLYLTAKTLLFDSVRKYNRLGEGEISRGIVKNWNDIGKWEYDAAKAEIDPTKTSFKIVRTPDPTSRTGFTYVRRTVEEEFNHKKSMYIADLKRQYNEYVKQQELSAFSRKKLAHEFGGVDASGRAVGGPEQRLQKVDDQLLADAIRLVNPLGGANTRDPKMLQKIVSSAMEAWDRAHPASQWTSSSTVNPATVGYGGIRPTDNRGYQAWMRARAEAEKRLYSRMGSEAPGVLESVINFGPVKGALDALGAPMGAIGGASKVIASVIAGSPAEFMATEGNIGIDSFPPAKRSQIVKDAEAMYAGSDKYIRYIVQQTYQGNLPAGASVEQYRNDPKIRDAALKMALKDAIKNASAWFDTTSEGRKWRDENNVLKGGLGVTTGRNVPEKQRMYGELDAFYKDFYEKGVGTVGIDLSGKLGPDGRPLSVFSYKGGEGDLGSIIKGLSEYGTLPFTPDSVMANLVTGIALDPTIMFPLKATTWGERLRYMIKESQGTFLKSSPLKRVLDFTKVTEQELRFEKAIRPLKADLASGMSPGTVRERELSALAGITTDAGRLDRIKAMQSVGLLPREADAHQLLSWAEDAIGAKVLASGYDLGRTMREIDTLKARWAERQAKKDLDVIRGESDVIADTSERRAKTVAEAGRAREEALHVAAIEKGRVMLRAEEAKIPKPPAVKPKASAAGVAAAVPAKPPVPAVRPKVAAAERVKIEARRNELLAEKNKFLDGDKVRPGMEQQARAANNAVEEFNRKYPPETRRVNLDEMRAVEAKASAAALPPGVEGKFANYSPNQGGDFVPKSGQSIYHGSREGDMVSFVDADGNLHLRYSSNFDGVQNGVSFTQSPATALDYASRVPGAGGARSKGGQVFKIDSSAFFPGSLRHESGEEIATFVKQDVIIPAGKWSASPVDATFAARRDAGNVRLRSQLSDMSDDDIVSEWNAKIERSEIIESDRGFEDPSASVRQHEAMSEMIEDELSYRIKSDSDVERLAAVLVRLTDENNWQFGYDTIEDARRQFARYLKRDAPGPKSPGSFAPAAVPTPAATRISIAQAAAVPAPSPGAIVPPPAAARVAGGFAAVRTAADTAVISARGRLDNALKNLSASLADEVKLATRVPRAGSTNLKKATSFLQREWVRAHNLPPTHPNFKNPLAEYELAVARLVNKSEREWARQAASNERILRDLSDSMSSIVANSISAPMMTIDAEKAIAGAVDAIKRLGDVTTGTGVLNGEVILKRLSADQGKRLFESRVIDYLAHETWIEAQRRIVKGVGSRFVGMPPAGLSSPGADNARRVLNRLVGMTEETWLRNAEKEAMALLASATNPAVKTAARQRLKDVSRARRVIDVMKQNATYTNPNRRALFAKKAVAMVEQRVIDAYSPKMISSYVSGLLGADVEQARDFYRLLTNSPVDSSVGKVPMVGKVSAHYVAKGVTMESSFNRPIQRHILERAGIPSNLVSDLTPLHILTGGDELANALLSPDFRRFRNDLLVDAKKALARITGDPKYTVEQFLSDRLMTRGTYFSVDEFDRIETAFSLAVQKERGWKRTSRTDLKTRMVIAPDSSVSEIVERDLRVVIAKVVAAKDLGVDLHMYNEARKVLRIGTVKRRYGKELIAWADSVAQAGGHKPRTKAYEEAYTKAFLEQRDVLRAEEAIKKAQELAGHQMYRSSPDDIAKEFEDLYMVGDQPKGGLPPAAITPYQKETLEHAVMERTGVKNVYDKDEMHKALTAHGQAPPFNDRAKMKAWLEQHGVWTPRIGTAIQNGEKSWSLIDEAAYYRSNWAFVPEWADPALISRNGKYADYLHDETVLAAMNRDWGVFSPNLEARFGQINATRAERVNNWVHGNVGLGLKPKRTLAMERKYAIERYGKLVNESGDGKTLTAMPWLMTPAEYPAYLAARGVDNVVALKLVQTPEELRVVTDLITKAMNKHWDEIMKGTAGATSEDILRFSAEIVHDILMDPVWLNRKADALGELIRGQGALQRAVFVFTQPGFLTTNVIDLSVKVPLARFNSRAFRTGRRSAAANSLDQMTLGMDRGTTLLSDASVAGTHRIQDVLASDKSMARKFAGTLHGTSELFAQGAGKAERWAKINIARDMYDGVYARALKNLGDADLADAFTKRFVASEATRLFPTVGDGPIERLLNQLSPFLSYQWKNRRLFLSELASHPGLYNWLERIGDAVESVNREEWAKTHPAGEPMPDNMARKMILPWTRDDPDGPAFLDIGDWSDASRGVAPLYRMAKGEGMTVRDFTALWVRVVGPAQQNLLAGIMNAAGWPMRKGWKAILDEKNFPTGRYERVDVPWNAPWGGTADWSNSIWLLDLFNSFEEFTDGKPLGVSAATVLGTQLLFFGGVKMQDRGLALSSLYYALKATDPAAAKKWLEGSQDGMLLRAWWVSHAARTRDFFTPQDIKDILSPPTYTDSNPWFHSQSEEFQNNVKRGWTALREIGLKWDHTIAGLTPGSPEYKEARLLFYTERYDYYRTHPDLFIYDAHQTPAEWAAQLDRWDMDGIRQGYYNLVAPEPEDFKTPALYELALIEWKAARTQYLKSNPKFAEDLLAVRTTIEGTWSAIEQTWFDTFDRIGVRSIALDAAKQAKNYDLVEQLYLINELDSTSLMKDNWTFYFDPTTDFKTLPRGAQGPRNVLPGLNGQTLVPHVKLFSDFTAWRFSRMTVAEQAKVERKSKYAIGMQKAIAHAKAGGKFSGAAFVAYMKANPDLMMEYFRENPGKQQEWATNDAYIKAMGGFGRLIKSGKFDEAFRYFDSMPAWVQARYYAKYPDRKKKRIDGLKYMNFMKLWTDFYRKRDYEGGAAYFAKLPQWVKDRYYNNNPGAQAKTAKNAEYMKYMKAWTDFYGEKDYEGGSEYFAAMPKWVKDRYYDNNPDKRDAGFGGSPYSKAMGGWVALLKEGKKEEAKAYFAAMPQAFKDRYYAKNPQKKLQDNVQRVGQLQTYFAADDANRAQYLLDNPSFAKWLKENDTGDSWRRMAILSAYGALPKDDQWLRRVFREKYPEVFSAEGKGARSLKGTYAQLAEHPDMLPAFEKWVAAVWASYAENMKHAATAPRPIEMMRFPSHGTKKYPGRHHGRSAEWVRIHSVV